MVATAFGLIHFHKSPGGQAFKRTTFFGDRYRDLPAPKNRFRIIEMLKVSKTTRAVFVCIAIVSCSHQRAEESPVIRLMERNAAGDLSTYSDVGFRQWFSARPMLARQVADMCGPIAKNPTANWATSVEGTACTAAIRTAPAHKLTADPRGW